MGADFPLLPPSSPLPHLALAPRLADDEHSDREMGLVVFLETLVIPAIISLLLYLGISHVVLPVWKRYKSRYGQYLPLDTISVHTSSWRQRLLDATARRLLPSSWTSEGGRDGVAVHAHDGSGSDFDEEDGEELYAVHDHRREALSLDARRGRHDDGRRLSRDLEEGFKDESEDDEDDADAHGDEEHHGQATMRSR